MMDPKLLYDYATESVDYLRNRANFNPRVGIILGTGLSGLADQIEAVATIPYADIPHFPVSTVEGHRGALIFGDLAGVPVVAMAGRFHYYEGYSMQEVTFPVRVMKLLGVERLIISNAAGSVNPVIEAGDIVFIRDHISQMPENPLRGANDERFGPRFPDMLHTYDRELNSRALRIALTEGLSAYEGVYLGLPGPNLETPAEYSTFHQLGADVVGMSTVPEVLVAKHMDLPLLVVSVVSNKCYPIDELTETTHEEVIAIVEQATQKLQKVIMRVLAMLG
jgi:purine-nucleoside phosphorylase